MVLDTSIAAATPIRTFQSKNDLLITNEVETNDINKNENYDNNDNSESDYQQDDDILVHLLKKKLKKNIKCTIINIDQLTCYFTPFNLEIIGRLIEVNFFLIYVLKRINLCCSFFALILYKL